jgi:putative ABC transport system permease protein
MSAADGAERWEQISLLVRSDHQPAALLPRIQDVVRHLDPNLAVYEAEALDARAHRMLEVERTLSYAVNGLAVAALWLAAIGALGVMAYGMARRTRELAVRIALGARRADVVRLALGEGARIAAAGIPIGLLLPVPVSRATGALVAGLAGTAPIGGEPVGPAAAAAVIVAGAMLAASYLPARRAARVDPALVFRSE